MLEFRVLGPFELRRDGALLDLGGARRAAFLALLVLNVGRVVSTERLVDELWGERPPRTALHVLHVYASALRKLLPAGVLQSRSPGYVLDLSPETIDLFEFERLVAGGRAALVRGDARAAATALDEAIGLWRGQMLEDLANEEFVMPEARRLEELRVATRELRAEAELALGGGPELVATLRALGQAHPFREHLQALLMRALAAAGRQAEALEVYTTTRERLDAELGIEPGAELRDAQRAVLRQEVGPSSPTSAAVTRMGLVLAVATDLTRLGPVAATADVLARGSGRELLVACVLDREAVPRPDLAAAARGAAGAAESATTSPARSAAFASRDPARDAGALAAEHDADIVILDAGADAAADGQLSAFVRAALEAISADVAILIGNPPAAGPVAAPFGGSSHDWAATELASLIARSTGSDLRLVGITTEDDDGSRLVARAALAVQRALGLRAEPVLAEPGATSLVSATADCGCVVLGVSERWRSEGLGSVRGAIAIASGGVLVVRRGLRPGLLAPAEARTRFAWSLAG